jgi:hypothetical protein
LCILLKDFGDDSDIKLLGCEFRKPKTNKDE